MKKLGVVRVTFTPADVQQSASKMIEGEKIYQVSYEMEVGESDRTISQRMDTLMTPFQTFSLREVTSSSGPLFTEPCEVTPPFNLRRASIRS